MPGRDRHRGHVAGKHDELALREVDRLGRLVDEDKAERDQRVHQPDGNAARKERNRELASSPMGIPPSMEGVPPLRLPLREGAAGRRRERQGRGERALAAVFKGDLVGDVHLRGSGIECVDDVGILFRDEAASHFARSVISASSASSSLFRSKRRRDVQSLRQRGVDLVDLLADQPRHPGLRLRSVSSCRTRRAARPRCPRWSDRSPPWRPRMGARHQTPLPRE